MGQFSITPSPRILKVLGAIPLRPVSALCELIDNSMDSFRAAELSGVQIPLRYIDVQVPTPAEVEQGRGTVQVRDNGVGMDLAQLEKSLTAGFSQKDNFDELGLYGVGFNLATVKLGPRTTVTTARSDSSGIRTVLDVPTLMKMDTFDIEYETDIDEVQRGTVVEVTGRWPEGDPLREFIYKLAKMPKAEVARQLGRIYASKLRHREGEPKLTMTLNGNVILPYEPCVWAENRVVQKRGTGPVPAQQHFDVLLRTRRRCRHDGTEIGVGETECSQCKKRDIRSIEERVWGWVGVQRYDHLNDFGIDVIRNGRLICRAEKEAFFSYVNDEGARITEYPVDSVYGRIVGEVHMDHVRPLANKEDFERATQEWVEALEVVRGGPLQRGHRPGGDRNSSPVGKIFNAYRDAKYGGPDSMYMGVYKPPPGKPSRVSGDVVEEFKKRFDEREPGFFDDAEWWKLVVAAVTPPIERLSRCPECSSDVRPAAIDCEACGYVLKTRSCRNADCRKEIAQNLEACPYCKASQVDAGDRIWTCGKCGTSNDSDISTCTNCKELSGIVIDRTWRCNRCREANPPELGECRECQLPKGLANPMSREELLKNSRLIPELLIDRQIFQSVDGTMLDPITIKVYEVEPGYLRPHFVSSPMPTFCPVGETFDSREVFVDLEHSFFRELGYTVEFAVATQVASLLAERIADRSDGRSVLNLTQLVLDAAYGERVSLSEQNLQREVESLFRRLAAVVMELDWSGELGIDLPPEDENQLADKLYQSGSLSAMESLKTTGGFLVYVPRAVPRLYRANPEQWERDVFIDPGINLPEKIRNTVNQLARRRRLRALEECSDFLDSPVRDQLILRQVKTMVSFLEAEVL